MFSARPNLLGSTVFQQVLKSCALFVIVSLAVLWAICGGLVWQMDRAQTARIEESVTYAEEVYYGRGVQALVDEEIRHDGNPLWPEDVIFAVRENGEQVIVLRNGNYDPIAGYYGLHADEGWQVTQLEHPEIDDPLRVLRVQLRGGDSLTVAEFQPEDRRDILGFAQFGSFALLLIVLPLALITGYGLSNRVFRRIETISATAAAVGAGQMASRAEQSPRHDEFDRLAGSINTMLDQVETLNSNIEAVSVGVAHDLRTPLTNIGGRLELIRRDSTDPDAVTTHVDAAEAAQSQLMRVFDALLRLGEVKAGRRRAAFAQVDLSTVVRTMADTFDPVFTDAHKTFTANVEPGLQVQGDQELIEQMIANLMENALEHSRDAAQVFVSLSKSNGGIALRVGDDGPGISPADHDRIFDRFFRADASRSTPGNGLGLSLVQAIAELHSAEISLDPNAKGAVFMIIFQMDA